MHSCPNGSLPSFLDIYTDNDKGDLFDKTMLQCIWMKITKLTYFVVQ